MNPAKRIAIVTLRVGAGHLRAAEAVHKALVDGGSELEVRTLDVVELSRPWRPMGSFGAAAGRFLNSSRTSRPIR